MADQLSYAFITPAALRKGRTGGILGRLISRSGLELHTGRVFAPSAKTLGDLADTLAGQPKTSAYLKALAAGSQGLVIVLKGEDAAAKVASVIGNDATMGGRGETIRDTYGDLIEDGGKTVYFEPGVIAPANATEAAAGLKLLAAASDAEGGILDAAASFTGPTEKTLVLIKPDNFAFPNTRPGGVIDLFARTGLALVRSEERRVGKECRL